MVAGICAAVAVAGCNGTASEPAAETTDVGHSHDGDQPHVSGEDLPEFDRIFAALVSGAADDASEAAEDESFAALAEAGSFNTPQNQAFLDFLMGKLEDSDPMVKAEAASMIALTRAELGIEEQSADLIPVFVSLLQHEDDWVRTRAIISLTPVVEADKLGTQRQSLVPALIMNLEDPPSDYAYSMAVSHLAQLGRMSIDALPLLLNAAEEEAKPDMKQHIREAIQKIETVAE